MTDQEYPQWQGSGEAGGVRDSQRGVQRWRRWTLIPAAPLTAAAYSRHWHAAAARKEHRSTPISSQLAQETLNGPKQGSSSLARSHTGRAALDQRTQNLTDAQMEPSSGESDELRRLREGLRRWPELVGVELAARLRASRDIPSSHQRLWGLVRDLLAGYRDASPGSQDAKACGAVSRPSPGS